METPKIIVIVRFKTKCKLRQLSSHKFDAMTLFNCKKVKFKVPVMYWSQTTDKSTDQCCSPKEPPGWAFY